MTTESSIESNLHALGLTLPAVSTPKAAYVMFTQSGHTLYLSGHLPQKEGHVWVGQCGRDITTQEGMAAAHNVALHLMATLKAACGGHLDRIQRILKLTCLVNATATFTEAHLVANGASELINQVFGDIGRHARSAFGVAQLPMGACVEIELIAEMT